MKARERPFLRYPQCVRIPFSCSFFFSRFQIYFFIMSPAVAFPDRQRRTGKTASRPMTDLNRSTAKMIIACSREEAA